ncbi:hypothetical protein ACN6AT_37035 (plasmid) [Streptomyces sp. JL4002]|uniref:hypothetical protein n=1 Tax=Streptomyces sp. JL4002 TaxID=3404781 RepID=UPI003B28630E
MLSRAAAGLRPSMWRWRSTNATTAGRTRRTATSSQPWPPHTGRVRIRAATVATIPASWFIV